LPVVVLGELLYGALNSAKPQKNEQAVHKFSAQSVLVPIDEAIAILTRTLQNRYVVVTGDLKSSRKLKDRAEVQEELKNALRIFQGARRE